MVSDANGMLMTIEGSSQVRLRAAGDMNFAEGTLWSEGGAGTNAIGTAIALDHAVQVFGPEHFSDPVQRWTCSAAPIHDPDTGAVIGVIDLTGDLSTVHPHSLAVATATARAVEASLQLALQERDARLQARYGDRVSPDRTRADDAQRPRDRRHPVRLGRRGPARDPARRRRARAASSGAEAVAEPVSPTLEAFVVHAVESRRVTSISRPLAKLGFLGRDRATLEIDGRTTELRPRLAEILALLCAHPNGMSADTLCADLHGDAAAASPASASRSAGCASCSARGSTPTATASPATSRPTCAASKACSPAGNVREAAETYAGPLLPNSEAPGVARERERLDAWLRQAVMTADDAEALWAWVHTRTGADDLGAWKRLLSQLEFRDPRRALCAAQVGELRRAALM